jgi:hypothetical protein
MCRAILILTVIFLVACSGGGGGSDSSSPGVRGVSCFHAAIDQSPVGCERIEGALAIGVASYASRTSALRFDESFPLYSVGGIVSDLVGLESGASATLVYWGSEDSSYQVTALTAVEPVTDSAFVRFRIFNAIPSSANALIVNVSGTGTLPVLQSGELSIYREIDPLVSSITFGGSHVGSVSLAGFEGKTVTIVVSGEEQLFTLATVIEEAAS